MKSSDFTAQIKTCIVDENVEMYRELFACTENPSDPYWQRALALYASLTAEQREIFFEIVRQTSIDTISNVFAVVDGVVRLDGQDGDCVMICGEDQLSGELHDHFLEHFER